MSKGNKSLISQEDCAEILKNGFGSNTALIKFSVVNLSQLGYLGEYFKLSIRYSYKNDPDASKTATFFAKTLPINNAAQKRFVQEMKVFRKEVLMYENLINEFLKLVSKPFASRSFFSQPDRFLILEDLVSKGFQVSKSNYFTLEQMKSLLKTLARFHGASLIFEELSSGKNSKKFRIGDCYKEELTESTFSFREGHPRHKWCLSNTKCIADIMDTALEEKNKKKVRDEFRSIVWNKLPKLLAPSEKFRNVCTHDDLWCTNIMFNDALESMLVDFQLTRYSPPAFDVMLCLMINLDNYIFREKKDMFLQVYYDALCHELEEHDLDPEDVLPKAEFYESIEFYYLPALIEAVMYGVNVYVDTELRERILSDKTVFDEFMFIDRSKYILVEYHENDIYRRRLNHVLIPLVEHLVSCIK